MKIQIEDKLYIESDDLQFTIKKYTGKFDKKTEKEQFTAHGYFGTLNQAVKQIIRMKVKASTATNLKELLVDLKRIENEVDELINI